MGFQTYLKNFCQTGFHLSLYACNINYSRLTHQLVERLKYGVHIIYIYIIYTFYIYIYILSCCLNSCSQGRDKRTPETSPMHLMYFFLILQVVVLLMVQKSGVYPVDVVNIPLSTWFSSEVVIAGF